MTSETSPSSDAGHMAAGPQHFGFVPPAPPLTNHWYPVGFVAFLVLLFFALRRRGKSRPLPMAASAQHMGVVQPAPPLKNPWILIGALAALALLGVVLWYFGKPLGP